MQKCSAKRESVLDFLNVASRNGAIFVYSMVNVDECQSSDRPEDFVEIIDGISAYFLEQSPVTDAEIALSSNRARELILHDDIIENGASRQLQDLFKLLHFSAGWLDEIDAADLKQEIADSLQYFWEVLERELPPQLLKLLVQEKSKALKAIRELPLQQLKDSDREWSDRFRKCLPTNFAQLDEVPDDKVVEYLLSCLKEEEQAEIRASFPSGFWTDVETRDEGKLAGFAFLLFRLGLVRDPRVRKKARKFREKHFRGQFRDCQHIEAATRCAVFMTFDKDAARLAKAVYAYAGVETRVIRLE